MAWVVVPLAVLSLLVVALAAAYAESYDPYEDLGTDTSSSSTYSTPDAPTTSATAATETETETETETGPETETGTTLLGHVPSAIADSCFSTDPPPDVGVTARLQCSDDDGSITVVYQQFASRSYMDIAFESLSGPVSGSCADGEAGQQPYGDGRYSCSVVEASGTSFFSWTHEPTDIMALAFSDTATPADLEAWYLLAGPL